MQTLESILATARELRASDVHLSEGLPPALRVDGRLCAAPFALTDGEARILLEGLCADAGLPLPGPGAADVDFAFSCGGTRCRANVYRQQGRIAATLRLLSDDIPTLEALGLPSVLTSLADEPRGLVLVTGPTGSGKSTTLAAMIDHINTTRPDHILTIEDPVEYVYQSRRALIHQREVGRDAPSFAAALRSALREDPDVILVGEMRDYETVSAAVTAAETGHLVLSTLHTVGAAQTIDRIIDACPANAQPQLRSQLSVVLRGVVTQQLLPAAAGRGRVAATEILIVTDAVANLIRENKCYQVNSVMQSGAALGMHTLNGDLARLVREGKISPDAALRCSTDKSDLKQYLL